MKELDGHGCCLKPSHSIDWPLKTPHSGSVLSFSPSHLQLSLLFRPFPPLTLSSRSSSRYYSLDSLFRDPIIFVSGKLISYLCSPGNVMEISLQFYKTGNVIPCPQTGNQSGGCCKLPLRKIHGLKFILRNMFIINEIYV